MSRRCSHCGLNGHNSRTCLDRGFKLFGVRLSDPSPSPSSSMRKSFSTSNLSNYGSEAAASSPSASPLEQPDVGDSLDGYASDDLVHTNSSARERKKGVPWTEEEHRLFLLGLQKLGKGDWRGISRNFIKTRTPTQVASHAQKYFLRRSNLQKRRRRTSLFDIVPDTVSCLPEEFVLEEPGFEGAESCPVIPELSLGQRMTFGDGGSMEGSVPGRHGYPVGAFQSTSLPHSRVPMSVFEIAEESNEAGETKDLEGCEMTDTVENTFLHPLSVMESVPGGNDGDLGGEANHLSLPYSCLTQWPGSGSHTAWSFESKIVKPTPIIPRPPVRIDDTMKLSELSLGVTRPVMEPTPLSYKLMEEGSRQSAFHSMNPVGSSELDTQGNLSSANAISVP